MARYDYLGVGHLVGTEYLEPDVFSYRYTPGSPATYDDLDRFNRPTTFDWYKDLATDRAFVNVALSYDRNSNLAVADESVHAGFDAAFAIDNLNRLTVADEGTYSGGSITSRTRKENWTLSQTGNWKVRQLDLNGDGSFTGSDLNELNPVDSAPAHFTQANEWTARDTNADGTDDYTLTYDATGSMNDDGKDYTYVYDAFYRLRQVKTRGGSPALVEEYRYNGLGHRIGMLYDTNNNGATSASGGGDVWFYHVLDLSWRNVATFRGNAVTPEADPKEQFIYNASAGSKLDDVFLRYRDMSNGWTGAADGTLEQLRYLCGNWRGDVVAVLTDTGAQVEQVRYSAYGVPFGMYAGDVDSDGDVDATDANQIQTWINGSVYSWLGDLDGDNDVDTNDKSACQANAGSNLGRSKLSLSSVGNRKGYGGYEADIALEPLMHVRHRVLHTGLGRWTRRDPIGYVDGANVYQYVRGNPTIYVDPSGLVWCSCTSTCGCEYDYSPGSPEYHVCVDGCCHALCSSDPWQGEHSDRLCLSWCLEHYPYDGDFLQACVEGCQSFDLDSLAPTQCQQVCRDINPIPADCSGAVHEYTCCMIEASYDQCVHAWCGGGFWSEIGGAFGLVWDTTHCVVDFIPIPFAHALFSQDSPIASHGWIELLQR